MNTSHPTIQGQANINAFLRIRNSHPDCIGIVQIGDQPPMAMFDTKKTPPYISISDIPKQ